MFTSDQIHKELSKTCLHGKNVYNKYTGQMMYQSCGKCEACLTRLASARSIKVGVQASLSKYTMFVTLTYDTYHVPKCKIYYNGDKKYCLVVKPRVKNYFYEERKDGSKHLKGLSYDDDFTVDFVAEKDYIDNFRKQASLNIDGKYPHLTDFYGYLSKKDLQLFMKRFRKRVNTFTNEKIHSYVVGEYSPKHFRPHFHLLFFFNSDTLASNFGQIVHSCWKFGRVDWSTSRGDAESYVAGYVNSFSCLPYHLGSSTKIAPFGRFSNYFAESCFNDATQALRDSFSRQEAPLFSPFLDGIPNLVNGKLLLTRPSRSCVDSCFFRKARDGRLSSHELLHLVRAVCNVIERGKRYFLRDDLKYSFLSHARFIVKTCKSFRYIKREKFFSLPSNISTVLYYARVDLTKEIQNYKNPDWDEAMSQSLYRLFLYTMRFVRFWKIDKMSYHEGIRLLDMCCKYYSLLDYRYLRQRFQFLEQCQEDIYDFYMHPTENFSDHLPSSVVLGINQYARERHQAAIKHREVNDLNIKYVKPYLPKKYEKTLPLCS